MDSTHRAKRRSRTDDPATSPGPRAVTALIQSARRIVHARENWGCYGMAAPFPASISVLIEELKHHLERYDGEPPAIRPAEDRIGEKEE